MTPSLLIRGGRVPATALGSATLHTAVTGYQTQDVYIGNTQIASVGASPQTAAGAVLDASACTLIPGFIDVHTHGADGHDTMDASGTALAAIARFKARHGVTAFLPTTMTAPVDATMAAVEAVNSVPVAPPEGARVLGLHMEGPFISPQYPGAQSPAHIRPPDRDEVARWLTGGNVRMITLAPETPGADALIRFALENDVVVVAGHTAAGFDAAMHAFNHGVTQATHTYNAMTGLHHRRPGTLGATLVHDGVYAQLIADNVHVHPAAMEILYRCKGLERVLLITDAMRASGLAEGSYTLGDHTVTVREGRCTLADGTLAGSILTMDMALRNFLAATGLTLDIAWRVASLNAAEALGLADKLGRVTPGYIADLTLLNADLRVVATIVGGEIVYLRDRERLSSA